METWQTAVVVLLALLVGAAIPILASLGTTLRVARQAVDRSGPELAQALAAVRSAAERMERLASHLDEGGRLERLFEAVTSLTQTVNQFRDVVRVASAAGAAVAPAVGAAVKAWREARHDDERGPDGHSEPREKGEGKENQS
ncbi:MAG TPA: hypothetical protein VFR85_19530 [Anaeromyxobacteraceae bacterium]|nr:hypothetical protein [Anaeromyxobacteraceae bacterium]